MKAECDHRIQFYCQATEFIAISIVFHDLSLSSNSSFLLQIFQTKIIAAFDEKQFRELTIFIGYNITYTAKHILIDHPT